VVELRPAPMRTRCGLKSKPLFKVVAWKNIDEPPPAERPLLSTREAERQEIDDDIPF
jgi:hypothetical protein